MSKYHILFDAHFGEYVNIKPEAYAFLNASFEEKHFDMKDLIVEYGSVDHYFYFVVSGIQAIYLINGKGEKVVLGFSFGGSVSGVYDSFLYETPSQLFLEALTPSTLIRIHKKSYLELFDLFPEFKDWRIHFIEKMFFGRAKREIEFLTLSARERFEAFMSRCPSELLTIPQKYLASYLNMTPETFSRMRSARL